MSEFSELHVVLVCELSQMWVHVSHELELRVQTRASALIFSFFNLAQSPLWAMQLCQDLEHRPTYIWGASRGRRCPFGGVPYDR